jgi:ATP-dependent Clp protease adaptor protein ClpS
VKTNNTIVLNWGVNTFSPDELADSETEVAVEDGRILVLHNDDYNTFDHVIKCLVEICDHDSIQAEQCAYIVHFRGKCDVMHGADEKLDVCRKLLILKGLSASIE